MSWPSPAGEDNKPDKPDAQIRSIRLTGSRTPQILQTEANNNHVGHITGWADALHRRDDRCSAQPLRLGVPSSVRDILRPAEDVGVRCGPCRPRGRERCAQRLWSGRPRPW